jgi:serine phosphatase RsbU (regulator of sigma subunit)
MGFFDVGIRSEQAENSKEQIILTNRITVAFIGVALFYTLLFTLLYQFLLALLAYLTVTVLLIAYFLSFKRFPLASKITLLWCTIVAVFCYSAILGAETGIFLFNLTIIAVSMMLFSNEEKYIRNITILAAITNFFILSFDWIQWPNQIALNRGTIHFLYVSISGMTIGIMIIAIIFFQKKFFSSLQTLQVINNQLKEKASKIQEQSKKIESTSLEIKKTAETQEKLLKQAGNYQTILFQKDEDIPQPINQKITVFGSASHHITGDYRYVFQINPHTSAIMALDVTGHGAPAAMMTGVLSKIVDDLFETSDPQLLMDTGKTMEVLNKTLYTERRLDKFVAGVYAVIDTVNMVIYVCCAGAETVMIVRDKKIIAIKNSNESLRMDENGKFTSVTQHIQSGDRILVCTDGLMDRKLKDESHLFTPIEAEGDYDEDAGEYPEIFLDYTKFESILTNLSKDNSFAESLGNTLDTLCLPASDDMTIVAVEIT